MTYSKENKTKTKQKYPNFGGKNVKVHGRSL